MNSRPLYRNNFLVTRSSSCLAACLAMVLLSSIPMFAQNCVPVPSGLVAWWQAESNAYDALGVNNGTLQGVSSYGAGEVGTAFSFDPGSGTMIVPDSPSLRLTNQLTIEAWINTQRTNSSSPDQEIVGKIGGISGNYGYEMLLSANSLIGEFNSPGQYWPADQVKIPLPIVPGTWNHVAFTYDQSAMTLYFNGQPVATNIIGPVVISATSANLHVSGDDNNHGYFAGLIDEVAVYNRALSATEIAGIYNAGAAGKCPTSSPPVIVSQPVNQTVPSGDTAVFSVVAQGSAPLSYQWSFNGTNLAGANNSSLTLASVQASQSGGYAVQVSNPSGSVTSSNAVLTVVPAPPCTPPPSGLVSWWRAEGDATDSVGINGGVLGGGAGFAPGEVGQAFSLNGSSQYVEIPNYPSLTPTGSFSIEAWIYLKQQTAGSQAVMSKWADAQVSYIFYVTPSNGMAFNISDAAHEGDEPFQTLATAANLIVVSNWTHVAGVYDQSTGTRHIYINGVEVANRTQPPMTIFNGSSIVGIGAIPPGSWSSLNSPFGGLIDEVSFYSQALSPAQVQGIYNAGSAGKCPIPIPPFIASQPSNQTITTGGTATFSVVAGGTAPLSYQWSFNGTNIAAATSPSLTLTNVLMSQAGNYSVQVTNLYGSTNSVSALLTVNPAPSVIQAVSLTATSGIVVLPINLLSQGNENALQFSIGFDPTLLTYTGATLGSGATNGSLLANVNQIGSGKLGLLISLPADASFSAGTQELAAVSFFVAPVTNTNVVSISFGDQPTAREVSSALPGILPAAYVNGTIVIPPLGIEADVFPIPNGDGSVAAIDVVQMGRFVAGLDVITNASEFQRADCAPRATLGDGQLTVADWVQAGRYAAALDPLVAAGGPTQPQGGGGLLIKGGPRIATGRTLMVPPDAVQAGQSFQLPVQLASQGDENGLEFSLVFDQSKLRYVSTVVGSGASTASMRLNTNSTVNGKLGIVMTLPTGSTFAAATQEVARVAFNVASSASGNTSVSFGTSPLPQQVVSALAADLPTAYVSDLIAITPITSPVLSVALAHGNLSLSWPVSATGFVLESNKTLTSSNWTSVSATSVTNASEVVVTVSASGPQTFYRLRHP